MKTKLLLLMLIISSLSTQAQSCEELMEYVKSEGSGTTYTSYTSEAISKVTFYTLYIDYQSHYFAIVCFKKNYGYGCNEYLYKVAHNTKLNYSLNYLNSAGKAFWNYIQPYNENLECAPDFE